MAKVKKNYMEGINEHSPWQDMTEGAFVFGPGNSEFFNTGDWRVKTPKWLQENCNQCLLCYPVCPDSSIPATSAGREEFDFEHCKGCGICASVCPFDAIVMTDVDEEEKL